jgi:hypothetical protein
VRVWNSGHLPGPLPRSPRRLSPPPANHPPPRQRSQPTLRLASNNNNINNQQFFPGIPKIRYEGPESTNPLAFRYYNADEVVAGKKMKDWCVIVGVRGIGGWERVGLCTAVLALFWQCVPRLALLPKSQSNN